VASEHSPVLASTFAPVTLSSSGVPFSEAQPETSQDTATAVMRNFMHCSPQLATI
jgi:hypothetical protein